MSKKWIIGVGGFLLLSACNGTGYISGRPISTFTEADVSTASAIAKAGNDSSGVACWGGMLPVAQAVQNGQAIGPATATELYRVVIIGAQGPCAPIVLPIMAQLGPLLGIASTLQVLPYVAPLAAVKR